MQTKYSRWYCTKWLWKNLWAFDHKIVYCMIVEAVFGAISPLSSIILPSVIIGILISGVSAGEIVKDICILFAIFGILQGISTYFTQRNNMQYIPWRAPFWGQIVVKCIHCDYQVFETQETQKEVKKIMIGMGNNDDGIEGYFHDAAKLLTYTFELILYCILVTMADIKVILVLVALSLISYLIHASINKKYIATKDAVAAMDVHLDYYRNLSYKTSSGKDIRLYQMQDHLKKLLAEVDRKVRKCEDYSQKYVTYAHLTSDTITLLRNALAYGYLLYMLIQGNFTVPEFVLYIGAVTAFSDRFIKLTEQLSHANRNLDLTGEMLNAFDALNSKNGSQKIQKMELEIVFDHVTFVYPGSDQKILDDFSLCIRPGEKLALVGINGAGKTTIVKLLCRMYHPVSGRILINDVDLEELNADDYMQYLGVIFQDSELYSYTIGENVSSLKEGDYDEQKVMDALKEAGASEFISSLKNGIHTYIGKEIDENGIDVSGGQKQKLLFARAWYKNPSILIMDEPTAALDAISEQELYSRYALLSKDKNALFISHRLASTKFCDRIVLLQNGKIAEEGTHDTLMQQHGIYYNMFNVQSSNTRKEGKKMKLKEFLHKTKNFMSLVNVDYPYAKYVILAYGVSTAVVPFLSLVCTAWILNSLIAQDYHSAVTAVWILVVGGGAFSMIQTVTGSKIEVYSRTIDNSISSQVNYKTYVMQYDAYERQGSLDAVRLARQKANGAGGAGSIMIEMPRFADACIETVLCFFFVGKLFYQTGSLSILQDGSFWIVVILLITFLYGGAKISAKSMKVFEDMQKMNIRNNSIGSYILQTGMMVSKKKDLQLYRLEDVTLHYLQSMYKSFYGYCEYGIINGRLTGLLAVLMNIFAAAAYIFVGFRAIQGSIAIGDVLLYAGAIQMLAGRAKDIVTAYNAIAFRIDFVDQFYEFIHAPAMHYEGTLPIEKRSDNDYALEFKDVSFCYPGTDTKVLDHINLKFRVGEKLALVGRNGAGKTTIVKLLCRFYEPTEGKILLNGIDIQKYDYAEYTSIFAPVFQDFEMFSLPVEDNVACTDHPDSVQLEEALKTVGMKERVDAMPEGIHTLLYHDNGEGTDISGGEAQKLAIARAWYKDAPFIILDEPTAALDPLAEAEIYENFNELIAGKTAIYISHRMSSCKFCNRIVVLADGKIVEEGTHQKLLAENGQYASLFNAQAEYYRS